MAAKGKKFHREKLAFIKRMLPEAKVNFPREMSIVKKIFDHFQNDIDFLSAVKPPFKFKDTLAFLISKDGWVYLELKRKEFYFKPQSIERHFEAGEKFGEDIELKKHKTLRQFLYE
jgi:hypothetical protein